MQDNSLSARSIFYEGDRRGALTSGHNFQKSSPYFTSGLFGQLTLEEKASCPLPCLLGCGPETPFSLSLSSKVNKALKQKSDIEHYRNKLRLKAKRKGYYDFPAVETSKGLTERKKMYEKAPKEVEHVLDPDPEVCPPFAESKNR